MPYSGLFLKAFLSDVLVIMDRVQFPRGSTWITRNRFTDSTGVLWLKVPVWKSGLGLQRISDVRLCHDRAWRRKHLEALKTSYLHAPFFEEHLPFLEDLYATEYERLVDLNLEILRYILKRLGFSTKLVLLTELGIEAKEPLLSVRVAQAVGAEKFIAQASARKYLDEGLFKAAGIKQIFFARRPVPYPQLWGGFCPNLSVLDLMFNCGPAAPKIILKELGPGSIGDPIGPSTCR
jgi:hypothetical protein